LRGASPHFHVRAVSAEKGARLVTGRLRLRGLVGTFHKMSRKYMPLYVAEFQFRYNNRENADIFGTAIKGC
jgi:hypothetical protein